MYNTRTIMKKAFPTTQNIVTAFKELIACDWNPTSEQVTITSELISFSQQNNYVISTDFKASFIEAVNQKLDLNAQAYQHILDTAFASGIKLNYILKTTIRKLLDRGDFTAYKKFLTTTKISNNNMFAAFKPISSKKSLSAVSEEVIGDKNSADIITALFSRYCFNLFDPRCTATFFSHDNNYKEDYFEYLSLKYPDLFNRDCSLAYIDITTQLFKTGYTQGCNTILQTILDAFKTLKNHCDLAINIPSISIGDKNIQWTLYKDIVLFAEKHIKEKIDKTYFRWQKIADITSKYIGSIKAKDAEWDFAFQGFVFKDCFVSKDSTTDGYNLLLILEKNVRDERPIFCPACRSSNIQGNSYPILNVRSWECENPLCPERSKYNRGKRYAFMSLMRQKQMLDEENRIDEASVAKWHLDCLDTPVPQSESFEMCVRHYSCVNDGVVVFSQSHSQQRFRINSGRKITLKHFPRPQGDLLTLFYNSAYFKRYLQPSPLSKSSPHKKQVIKKATIINGDALSVMSRLPACSIDGAVTSPPYYNAKEYSKWDNIYCYLYDMFNISRELFRILKNGGVYLFNIFDYFDNENNIVLSAMGNKRMILGAYMLDIFEKIGFTIIGNIIWNKGEIQGSRSFNQGNMTPYYQAPLNCWEHIFILSKGKPNKKFAELTSSIKLIRPVIKIVKGKNILGHTAPYPEEIPELLIKHLAQEDTVFDPFLGSGTTCIVANHYNVNSIGTELDANYYTLCTKRIAEQQEQFLF